MVIKLPLTGPEGEQLFHVSRIWLVEGPRWLLRGTLMGQAGLVEGEKPPADFFVEFFRNLVVRRDDAPRSPGEIIQLALPDTASRPASANANASTGTTELPLAQRPKRKPVITLLALFLGVFGAHRFYMGSWGWGLLQLLGVPVVIGILAALLPPLGGLLYFAAIAFIWVEMVRYIWMSDAEFDAKVQRYQAARPGPFSFFW